jgi:hypothetical protein
MASKFSSRVLPRVLAAVACLGAVSLPAQVPLPLPPAAQVLKPLAGKIVDAILKPKMKVDHFTVGGFTVTEVDPTTDATPEAFEGTGLLEMPAPGHPTKITFKNLVLKGTAAEGSVEADFPVGHHAMVQGWLYELKKAVISDKGAHLEGHATLAAIRLDLAPLSFTPTGLQGSLTPGDLPLAEGHFIATLKNAEVVFGPNAPQLKGTVKVEIEAPVRHALTGDLVTLESALVSFSSQILTPSATGPVVDGLALDLPLLHQGSTWRMEKVSFGFERGTPWLGGLTRLQFHLNVFCQVGATDQPYLTGPASCRIEGTAAKLETSARGRQRTAILKASDFLLGFEGFTANFPLVGATLHPSGLTAYKLQLDGGNAWVKKGVVDPESSRISGKLSWGPNFAYELNIADAPAALSDGLYVASGTMSTPAQVGAYHVYSWIGAVVCDFSLSKSPGDLPPEWKGVYLPGYSVVLPADLYRLNNSGTHVAAAMLGAGGRFEGNGSFSANVMGAFTDPLMLYIAPVKLQPFQLNFVDGVVLNGPTVSGQLEVIAPPLLDDYKAPITFNLTQEGVQKVEVQGGQVLKSNLIGVDTVLDHAVLNPTNLDFTGRFDFHVSGAALPSIAFDHLVFQATGGGINGETGPLKFGVTGARWDNLADHQKVDLWGFGFDLTESGFGIMPDGRYYVGFGGQMDVNPMVPTIYNRVVFTTDAKAPSKGTVEIEKSFHLDQNMAGLGSLKTDLGFTVEAQGDQVSQAYFLGTGSLAMNMGDSPFNMDAGVRFGRKMEATGSFPYFYALGHVQSGSAGVQVAPDVEIYGLVGGLAQNFKPAEIRDTTDIKGVPDASLGFALAAGVDLGTTDQYTFHGGLDLYIAQNLTTLLQGKGWLFCGRDATDNEVTANIAFTRNPNVFDASFGADIQQAGGMMRYIGNVALHFGPDKRFLHLGTPEAPIQASYAGLANGNGYFMADFENGMSRLSAGAGFSVDSGDRDFGPLYGRAWLNARGDLVIELDAARNPHFRGSVNANGGAEFGMKFETFWHTYHITIFSGDLSTAMAFQAPGSPRLSGRVTLHYSVLGGAFSGNVSANLDF